MRLLSDFDGVWTHPLEEARAQGEILEGLLVEWSEPGARDAVHAWLADARAAVRAEPTRWGWAPGGAALAAFGDEDPFAEHSALLHFLHAHREESLPGSLVAAIAAHGFATLDVFGGHCHAQGVARVEAARGPGPGAVAGDVFSLDLALPLALKLTEPAWRSVRLFWLLQDYTPARMREAIGRGARDDVEPVEGGLPGLAARLLAG